MVCVENAKVMRDQSAVARRDGELAGIGKVAAGSTDGRPADGATARAEKIVAPSSGPASVIVPAVHSPTGLVQFCVVNRLWIVPCTGQHVTGGAAAAITWLRQ